MNSISFYKRKEIFYHLTVRITDTLSAEKDPEYEYKKINFAIRDLIKQHSIQVHAYVFMYDHFHLLIAISSNYDANIYFSINQFLTSKIEVKKIQWQKISNFRAYQETYRYIYLNPLKAGYCDRIVDYSYSSYRWLLGYESPDFPIIDQMNLIYNPKGVQQFIHLGESQVEHFLFF